ncbi:STAS domain-containing protein [Paucidesulfovibrio longus]|uniref:STAS domain-containing protein n=1 Tax=Paucidesulfovibrio longus TaxID=889 RepID=UPI0003B30EC1|nr:STAS domain-containing protein [Paucidesulfovibrio longus]
MEFKSEKLGDYVVLSVAGRMDALTAGEFEKQCCQCMDAGDAKIVADMGGVDYISSAGLRSILSAAKKLRGSQGEIRFCGLSGMVNDVFTVSGFAAMFKIFDTAADATKA